MILEYMINYHKQLFPNSSSQQDNEQNQPQKSYKSQPDIIPTKYHSKSRSSSNENLLDVQNSASHIPPSPGTRRKNKAPLPLPSSSTISQQTLCNENVLSSEQQNSNEQYLTVQNSPSFNQNDKIHRRTLSDGTQLDRPSAAPLLPPSSVLAPPLTHIQTKPKLSIPLTNNNNNDNEQASCSSQKDKSNNSETSTDITNTPIPTNDGVNVGKLISELNNRMAAAKLNNAQTNNVRASSIRNSILNSAGETTDF